MRAELRYSGGSPLSSRAERNSVGTNSGAARSSRATSSSSQQASVPHPPSLSQLPADDDDDLSVGTSTPASNKPGVSLGNAQLDLTAQNLAHLEGIKRGGFPEFVFLEPEDCSFIEISIPALIRSAIAKWKEAVKGARTPGISILRYPCPLLI